MDEHELIAKRFEENRPHLRSVAYRMLGSLSEADDAVQEAWLRLGRADANHIENLGGWLTTVVARVCLDMLRTRRSRREESMDARVAEPVADGAGANDVEQEALLADSVGLALLVVLDRLNPAERVAFVLHDTFAVPFEEIAAILGRSETAARQLASRARRRVRGATTDGADLAEQREVVGLFLAALRAGDFEGLMAVLDPDMVARLDEEAAQAGGRREIRGAENWARGALAYSRIARFVQPALVNGSVGLVWAPHGRLHRALRFMIERGKIVQIEVVANAARIRELEVGTLSD